jgi:hypothetical protein
MPYFYCGTCDEVYAPYSPAGKICPLCKGQLQYYRSKDEIPIGPRCQNCSLIHTQGCGPAVYWSPTAPFYSKPCPKFEAKSRT